MVGYNKMYSQFVEPILLYSTEVWTSANSAIDLLERSYMKTLRTLQNLPDRTASVGVMALLGAQPIRAKVHQRRLSFLWNIIQSDSLYTYTIIERQAVMGKKKSWTSETNDILRTYNLPVIGDLLADLPGKTAWKARVKTTVGEFWRRKMAEEIHSKSSLRFLQPDPDLLKSAHPVWHASLSDTRTSKQARTRAKLLTGSFTLQAHISKFNQNPVNPTCKNASDFTMLL